MTPSIHPFPARMAPEICRDVLTRLPVNSRVIDPMCGSGTVLRNAVELGHDAVGVDMDPLAVLMSKVWTTATPAHRLIHDAATIAERAAALPDVEAHPPWNEAETEDFANYWFATEQRDQLTRLSAVLRRSRLQSLPFLWLCLSRLVITKDRGASLARDVSHSRPHRVTLANDFDVYGQFVRAARTVARRLDPDRIRGEALVVQGDARQASSLRLGSFDAAITSPPYLNAIDYLRGHRLALIWLGHEIRDLRTVRSAEIGSERRSERSPIDVGAHIDVATDSTLTDRHTGWIRRYAADMLKTTDSLAELVDPGGAVVIVVGNSLLRGASVDNAGIITECATRSGLSHVDTQTRVIPARRRYLPPPTQGSALARRMREESVITFEVERKPGARSKTNSSR